MQLSVGDRTLEYDVRGDGADALIFIPALGATRAMWEPQVPQFEADFTVVLYEPGGHYPQGGSGDKITLWGMADDLEALATAVGARRPHLVGLSMGGMIAQTFAIRYRDRVKSLVLASTTSSYPEESRRQIAQRAEIASREGMGPLINGTIERWFTDAFRQAHSETVDWIRGMLRSADPWAYAAAARAVSEVDTTARLRDIAAPTLVLKPESDQSMPADAASVLESHIPAARCKVIDAASHLCNVENPEAFNREVSEFVRGVNERTPGEAGIPGLPG